MKTNHRAFPKPVRHARSVTAFVLLMVTSLVWAADTTNKPRVEKRTFSVAMRDGVKLGTDVYLPSTNGTFPALLLRTPYSKAMGAGIGEDGARHGYATVIQDTRGRFSSEGANLAFDADVEDGYDAVEWVIRQPWCNGKLGARFHESFSQEKLLKAGEVGVFDLELWSTSFVFNKGHRLRVHVTSSSAPGFDPNPNTGEGFRHSANARVARNSIYCDGDHPSHLLLPVVNGPGR